MPKTSKPKRARRPLTTRELEIAQLGKAIARTDLNITVTRDALDQLFEKKARQRAELLRQQLLLRAENN